MTKGLNHDKCECGQELNFLDDTVLQQRAEEMSKVREAAQSGQGIDRLEKGRRYKMTQEEFKTLKPGDKVRIVKEKGEGCWNKEYRMDKWLGKVMTVRKILDIYGTIVARMEEDEGEYISGWYWYPEMIDCKVVDVPSNAKAQKEDEMRIVDEQGFPIDEHYFKDEGVDEEGEAIPPFVSGREETKRKEVPGKDLRKRFLRELTGEKGPFEWSDFGVEFTQRWDEVSLEMVMEAFDRAVEEE